MRNWLIVVVPFAALLGFSTCLGQDYTASSYKVLSKDRLHGNALTYRISVDTWIWKHENLARLICAFVEREKPADYDRMFIGIYFHLDRYEPDVETPVLTKINDVHSIGSYGWNRALPGNPFALSIYKDVHNNDLKGGTKSIPFDHLKDCVKYSEAKSH